MIESEARDPPDVEEEPAHRLAGHGPHALEAGLEVHVAEAVRPATQNGNVSHTITVSAVFRTNKTPFKAIHEFMPIL